MYMLSWIRANLFNSVWSSFVTLALAYLFVKLGLELVSWSLIHSVWAVGTDAAGTLDLSHCRAARGAGACWAVIGDKYRLILFGRYPFAEQWRVAIVIMLFGTKRLRTLGTDLGSAVKGFRKSMSDDGAADKPADDVSANSPGNNDVKEK